MRLVRRHRYQCAGLVHIVGMALAMAGCTQDNFDPHRTAGAWQQSVTLERVGGNSLLPEAAKSPVAVAQFSDPICITNSSVSADTLESRLTDIAILGPEWTFGTITVTDGTVNATATGPLGKITYSGKLAPRISDITMTTAAGTIAAGTSAQDQTTTIQRIRAEHIGPCTPDMVIMGQ